MNFDDIKKEMDRDVAEEVSLGGKINMGTGKNNPVAKIRRNIKVEILFQLTAIIILMFVPMIEPMEKLPRGIYLILMFVICLIMLGYTLKLGQILGKTKELATSTRNALQQFVFETNLALEVYKSYTIAASLILPIPIFILKTGRITKGNMPLFEKWITLDFTSMELAVLIISYLFIALIIYIITITHTKYLYGKYLNELENRIEELDE